MSTNKTIFSYHLVKISFFLAIKNLLISPVKRTTGGIIHSEYMTAMTLGSPLFSPSRFLTREVCLFTQWKDEGALDEYLKNDNFGKVLAEGWHVRLEFIRQWGEVNCFEIPEQKSRLESPKSPVVAVTLARMKPFSIPRFLKWGRPVEKLVRDHSGTLLSLASIRFPNTISTFSIWKSELEMNSMVHGHSSVPKPKRHSDAMKERERKKFHFEFTTLRFKPISEIGSWKGRENYINGKSKV